MSKQGWTVPAGPPRICDCGRRFTPSAVVESRGGTGRTRQKCPSCKALEKRAKRLKKQQKENGTNPGPSPDKS